MEKVEAPNLNNNKGKQIIPQEENKPSIKKRDHLEIYDSFLSY